MAGQLDGRRIVVTGAATGIGAAALQVLAAEGAHLAAVYRESAPPVDLVDTARWWQCDLRDQAAVDELFALATADLGGLDALIHCAGFWHHATPESMTVDELDEMLAVNLKSTVFTNQAAFGPLRDGGGGAIVNLGSSEGVFGNPIAPGYSIAKAGVHVWTRACARAWGRHGIRVNTVSPCMETPGMERWREHMGPEALPAIEEGIKQAIAAGRVGDPVEDLGPVLTFLASPGARFITGQLLPVDGGTIMVGA
jgi:NAD(P)-dependent dehydrogenase (short-subunit alcohol dehydrogenase family)